MSYQKLLISQNPKFKAKLKHNYIPPQLLLGSKINNFRDIMESLGKHVKRKFQIPNEIQGIN